MCGVRTTQKVGDEEEQHCETFYVGNSRTKSQKRCEICYGNFKTQSHPDDGPLSWLFVLDTGLRGFILCSQGKKLNMRTGNIR